MRSFLRLALLAAALLLWVPSAAAEEVVFVITAEITQVVDGTPSQLWASHFSIGETITGTLRYDSELPDSEPGPMTGTYEAPPPSAPNGLTLQLGGVTLLPDSTLTFGVDVFDLPGFDLDSFTVNHFGDWESEIPGGAIVTLTLGSGAEEALPSDALPTDLDLSLFVARTLTLDGALQGGECVGLGAPCVVGATVTSFERVGVVPATGVAHLLAGGAVLAALGAWLLGRSDPA